LDISEIAKQAADAQAEDFVRTVKEATEVLRSEEGTIGNLTFQGKLVHCKPVGEALVVGDLHGDLESFAAIMEKSQFASRMEQNKNATVVFLGDYGDRGANSIEVYYAVLRLKLAFPSQVVLLRGNHEGPTDLLASPHDLPTQFQFRFKEKWVPIYSKVRELFDDFYTAVYVAERYLMVHGGLPAKIRSLQEIAEAHQLHPQKPFLEELLWNDPDEAVKGTFPSPRGAGNLFGKEVTYEVLSKLNAKLLIRGHEPSGEGFKFNHGGKVLTLFSRKGPPYFNIHGAYLHVPLTEEFEDANQLLPYIHKF
jgi:protein phosphatase